MAGLYLVDSSVWVRALRRAGPPGVRRRFEELLIANQAATCEMVKLELLRAAANESEFALLEARLQGLHQLSTGPGDWLDAARLGSALRQVGVTVASPDLLIGAIALRHDAIILHADRDFELIARHTGLQTESMLPIADD